MTAPQQSCPRCHLYLSARGCTPERCANPEGAAELERLTREEALAGSGVTKGRVLPPNDLADFCSLLGRMGCSYERGKTRTGWYVRTDEGYFFFDAASGRFRTNGIDPVERAEFDKWIARREVDLPVTAVVRKQGPQSDLDTFRAMLERAGIKFGQCEDTQSKGQFIELTDRWTVNTPRDGKVRGRIYVEFKPDGSLDAVQGYDE